jgi:hypothetical protein
MRMRKELSEGQGRAVNEVHDTQAVVPTASCLQMIFILTSLVDLGSTVSILTRLQDPDYGSKIQTAFRRPGTTAIAVTRDLDLV